MILLGSVAIPYFNTIVSSLDRKKGTIAFSFFNTSIIVISFMIKSTTSKTCYTPMTCMRFVIAMGETLLRTSRNDATLRHTTSTTCLILLMIILIMPMREVSYSIMWRGDSFVGVESNSGCFLA